MEDDLQDFAEFLSAHLVEQSQRFYTMRAHAAGRTLAAQLVYEFKVMLGYLNPDSDDGYGTRTRQLFLRALPGQSGNA